MRGLALGKVGRLDAYSPAGWHIELPLTQTNSPMPWLAQLLRQLP